MSVKDISKIVLWLPLCSLERNHLCNLVECIMRNKSVKLFKFGPVVLEEMLFKDILSTALAALLFIGAMSFMQFW